MSAKLDKSIDFHLRKLTVCDEVVQERDISRLKKKLQSDQRDQCQQKTAVKQLHHLQSQDLMYDLCYVSGR